MQRLRFKATVGALLDLLLAPLLLPSAVLLKLARRVGLNRLRFCRKILLKIGVLPIREHYYEPFPDVSGLSSKAELDRSLPGIEWNVPQQLSFMRNLSYAGELDSWRCAGKSNISFSFNNGSFESGDAEFLYQMVRFLKPKRFFEIGSGNSTLITRQAITKNKEEVPGYECRHLCIEPFEAPWLERAGIATLRSKVEDVDLALFDQLSCDDILFIDSSHVIRPGGDVLVEYLQILPRLKEGVIVHVHDIFSPRDYPKEWIIDRISLWNEQYLLEAFISENRSWKVLAALNQLRHLHFDRLRSVCPYLTRDREPGSFYIQKLA